MGKKCSEFIEDGDCIFIDSGSTTYHIAKHLKNNKNLTIITNSIPVVNQFINTDCEIRSLQEEKSSKDLRKSLWLLIAVNLVQM
ncbi:DeoR/GlpR family DNA-binding transcription regulator [Marinisporobacter balticus]|uniref:hypothetical protein n=1 Tax=Marinisporobacter balticus TaxID=2018667 RepID=UPI001A9BF1CE